MKKNLLISLSVMIFLIIIVGVTTYSLSNNWVHMSKMFTNKFTMNILLDDITRSIDLMTIETENYILNRSSKSLNIISVQNKKILKLFKLIKDFSNKPNASSSERIIFQSIKSFYANNIFDLIQQISKNPDSENTQQKLYTLKNNSNNIIKQLNIRRSSSIPSYQNYIERMYNYSNFTTITITLICAFLGMVLVTISFSYITKLYGRIENQNKDLEQSLTDIRKINKDLITSNDLNIKIQEAERLRVAQDLHDDIIQNLISLVRKTDQTSTPEVLNDIKKDIKIIITDIKHICQNLRPSILDDLGLNSSIEWLFEGLEKNGIAASVEIKNKTHKKVNKKTELTIFRVIQELTNNIKKHSQATHAELSINYTDELIKINLKDNGCGFVYNECELKKSLGLIGLEERIKSVSGDVIFDTGENKGTTVEIIIPLVD